MLGDDDGWPAWFPGSEFAAIRAATEVDRKPTDGR
jgi:hypothetical protein